MPSDRIGNYAKTALLLAALTALALYLGERMGGPRGVVVAAVFVGLMNFVSYWFSDRIALAMHGAKPVSQQDAPRLYAAVAELVQRAELPMPRLFIIQTPTPNAFATGRNPEHAAVAVTTGLLERMGPRELKGVLAHELAHVKNRDTLTSTVAATLAGVISYAARAFMWFGNASSDRRRDDSGGGAGGLLLIIVAPIVAMLLQLAISRAREYGADATGASFTQDPEGLAGALLRLEDDNRALPYDRDVATAHLFVVNPLSRSGIFGLFSTHPPVAERVRRLREFRG